MPGSDFKSHSTFRATCPDCGREIGVGTDKFNRTERDRGGCYRIYPHINLETRVRCTASRSYIAPVAVWQAIGTVDA